MAITTFRDKRHQTSRMKLIATDLLCYKNTAKTDGSN